MLSIEDVQDILSIELLGVIPESQSVLNASNSGVPVVLDEASDAGQAYLDAVARFLGEERPASFHHAPEERFLRTPVRGLNAMGIFDYFRSPEAQDGLCRPRRGCRSSSPASVPTARVPTIFRHCTGRSSR
jgi:hypothetical protein